MAEPVPTDWPTWENSPIELYHGTLLKHAGEMASRRIDVNRGRARTDFGRGFYTTTNVETARQWSQQVWARTADSQPAVVKLGLDRVALGQLLSLCFVRCSKAAEDYWSFIQNCRAGFTHLHSTLGQYDVVCGPIALRWNGPGASATLTDSDQISFHSIAAQDILNNVRLCQLEVLA